MKRTKLLFVMLIVASLVIFSCSEDSTSSDTQAPTVVITYPANNSQFAQGTVITINADATDNKGVKEVRFYIDGDFVSLDETEPYQYEWDTGNSRDTDHTIYAKAYDTSDNSSTSEVITVTLYDGGGGGDFEWCDVPAGDYTYGDPPVTQNINYDFQIMKYEVTNQQYVDYLAEALNAGDITVTSSTAEGYYTGDQNYGAGTYEFLDLNSSYCRIDWDGSNFSIISGYEDHPVVEVTWFGSWAFAEHYNLRLPTEQEWEKAARGNTGYDYPWGNSIDGSRANYWDSGDPFEGNDVETTPVGMYNGQTIQGFSTTDSPSPYGVYDLAGNVWEWTDSWWSDTSSYRVVRGGGWDTYTYSLLSWSRNSGGDPSISSGSIGFRCVVP